MYEHETFVINTKIYMESLKSEARDRLELPLPTFIREEFRNMKQEGLM